MTRPAPVIAGILAALLLLFGAYMGAYYTMLAKHQIWYDDEVITPIYRTENGYVDQAFWPAHLLDRLIRPHYWDDK